MKSAGPRLTSSVENREREASSKSFALCLGRSSVP
ncbi:aaa family atpase, partial [Moniliophthora roreri]